MSKLLVKNLTKTAQKIRRRMMREHGVKEGARIFEETMVKYRMTKKWTKKS